MYRLLISAVLIPLSLLVPVSLPAGAQDYTHRVAGWERPNGKAAKPKARDFLWCQNRLKRQAECFDTRRFWRGSIDMDRNIGAGRQAVGQRGFRR